MNGINKPNTFVAKVDISLAEKMKSDLVLQGFALSQPQYTEFCAKKKGVSCTLFTSGKLVIQGKDKDDFISFYLEPEILGEFVYGYESATVDTHPRIGIDEAGKGDFYGPLCIAGVYADTEGVQKLLDMGVKDSKRMNDKTICTLASKIKSHFPHSIVRLFPEKYNELYEKFRNLNHLLAWGHATAIEELVSKTGCHEAIIDQFANESVVHKALDRKQLNISLTQKHYGESDPVVAAASILARCGFVEGIDSLGNRLQITLPKGANPQVIAVGRQLVRKHGLAILGQVAKLHFKTKEAILHAGSLDD